MPKVWANSGLDLHIELSGARGRSDLEAALRGAVRSGRLRAGGRLPPTRALAGDLGLARNTVAAAYAQLVAEGWLEARQGAGTWVAAVGEGQPAPISAAAVSRPPSYDLRPGSPDLATFPRAEWLRSAKRALGATAAEAFGYPDVGGRIELRRALAGYLGRVRGVEATPDRIVICSGFAQGLSVVAASLRAVGVTNVAVEGFAHPGHARILTSSGLVTVAVGIDEQGARLEDVGGAQAALLTPAHQFPLGPTLAPARRLAAVEWAHTSGAFIIEDDYDGEFRYDRQPIGALQALAPERVIYAGTASKTLAPGLRLGWLVVPASLAAAAVDAKRLSDGPSALDQLTIARFISDGNYDRHIRRVRAGYSRRRDQLVASLTRAVPNIEIGGAAAGMHVIVNLPRGLSEQDAIVRARKCGLALDGLTSYRLGTERRSPALVVGYGTPPEHKFSAAVARLCAVLRGD